ncbi:MAG: hypothetical protein BKPUNTRY_002386, partial [Candidatus Fervidibacter sp.]
AFRRQGIDVDGVPNGFPANAEVGELLSDGLSLIVHPEISALIPKDLDQAPVPTVCFQIDTYTYTHRRICWSMLFDYAALFHPGFEDRFRRAGHPRPLTLLHAIDPESFQGPEHERVFDIGWVGRTDGPYYRTRRKVLPLLAQRFLMNDWQRRYSYEEMVEVYKRSKIVVNISRDDYPQDLNLRCLEAMAAGALLITKLPTELSRVGFQEGEHFIGYTNEQELLDLVRYYLNHDLERRRIAEAGRTKVLQEHTYDRRVEQLLQTLAKDKGTLFAPARRWSEDKVRLIYLDYYAGHNLLGLAWEELKRIVRLNPQTAVQALGPIIGALRRKWR